MLAQQRCQGRARTSVRVQSSAASWRCRLDVMLDSDDGRQELQMMVGPSKK